MKPRHLIEAEVSVDELRALVHELVAEALRPIRRELLAHGERVDAHDRRFPPAPERPAGLMTAKEIAPLADLDPSTVYHAKTIRSVKVRGRRYFDPASLATK